MEIVVRGASTLGAAQGLMDAGSSALLTLVRNRNIDNGHLLYLVPRHALVSARKQAHVLLAQARNTSVCVLAGDHHPLTLALVGSLVADLARNGVWSNPGHGVQLAQQALADTRSLVWHPRLSGVQQPQPKAGQRWMSLLPGRSYLTRLGDDTVRRTPARLEIRPQETVYTSSEPPAQLAAALSGLQVNRVDIQTDAAGPYRGRGAIELTTMPPLWPSGPVGPICAGCGAYQVGDWCAFCNHRPYRTDASTVERVGNPALSARV